MNYGLVQWVLLNRLLRIRYLSIKVSILPMDEVNMILLDDNFCTREPKGTRTPDQDIMSVALFLLSYRLLIENIDIEEVSNFLRISINDNLTYLSIQVH